MPPHGNFIMPDDAKKRKFDIKLFFWLFKYLKEYKLTFVFSLFLIIGSSILALANPYIMGRGVDKFIMKNDPKGLLTLVIIFLGINIVILLFGYLKTYLMVYLGSKVMYRLRNDIFEHIVRLPKRYFDKTPIGKIMTRVTSDVQALNELLTSGVVVFLGDLLMLAAILVYLFIMNWRLTLILLLSTIPLLILSATIFRRKVVLLYRKQREIIAKINAFLQESIVGITVIQLFNRVKLNKENFKELNEANFTARYKSMLANATFFPFVSFLSVLGKAIIIWYGGLQYLKSNLTLGQIVAFLGYIEMFFRPLRDMSQKYNIFQAAMAASEKIKSIMNEKESAIYNTIDGYKGDIKGKIEFRNVWFAYDDDNYVLKDVSFVIEPGEMVAIVGQTGSGKTTIISLLGRFYDIQKGNIFIDGVDIKEWDILYLRKNLGIVLQDVFLFSGNVKENISLYNESFEDEYIREVINYVNADKFIERLPNELETPILERGKSISAGQRQLLSFARSLAYNPKILILDEATSNIDSETEQYIQEAIEKITKERTSIVIAHRLSTIKKATKIIVIHKGKIREIGTHNELMNKKGIYYDLYQLQYKEQEKYISS